ncbi:MAG: cell division topological specificity factor MinE [Lachnospiraceae bacterium]|nr:cell division topological specificity factor MinE [Lachnospiraceae bacterium]MCR5411279.1 cell division topological specificity factor MinE [Lachnospiraceae bacterium]
MSFADFFRRKTSGETAKDRLKFVLVSDRSACSPEIMERIKNDIIEVLSKYVDIDKEGLDIKITQVDGEGPDEKSGPALFANIPIKEILTRN